MNVITSAKVLLNLNILGPICMCISMTVVLFTYSAYIMYVCNITFSAFVMYILIILRIVDHYLLTLAPYIKVDAWP